MSHESSDSPSSDKAKKKKKRSRRVVQVVAVIEDVSVHRAVVSPMKEMSAERVPERKFSTASSSQTGEEDKISFSRSGGGETIWALSRRKLDSMRTLGTSASSALSAPDRSGGPSAVSGSGWDDKAASMDLSLLRLAPRSSATRRSTFSVPKRVATVQQVVLSKEEVRELKKTLSDPMIKSHMVAADDDKALNEWLEDGNATANRVASGRRRSVLEIPTPTSLKTARTVLRQLAHELDDRIPEPQRLTELFAKRETRIKKEFEAARFNPLHHLETSANAGGPPISGKTRAKTTRIEAQQLLSNMAALAPAAPMNMAASVASSSAGSRKLLVVRKDCVLNYDIEQERYVLKQATCDRMIVSLVDRFWEVEKDATLKKDKKAKKARFAEVVATARHFCVGSLKLWSPNEVLSAMLRLMTDLVAHANKMQGTDWAATSDLGCLEQLVRVWLQECFPQCVKVLWMYMVELTGFVLTKKKKDSETLQSFTALVAAMPSRDTIESDIVQLSQAKSQLLRRGATATGKKSVLKKRTQRMFTPAPPPLPNDFLQVDLLDVPATELALELTRITLGLFRDISVDKLVKRDLSGQAAKSSMDLPPLFVLRARTERLSNWTASNVVGEKLLKRRVAIFTKMVAIAAKLADMRNLHDAVAMVTALHNPAVSRLRQTNAAAGETVNTAFQRLTNLIRPPYQNLRKKVASWAESQEQESAYLPPLEVLLQDMQKLDEIEENFVPHPENPDILLGNVWKTNLLGAWIVKFNDGFRKRVFEFEGQEQTNRSQVIGALAKVLPDSFNPDTLWAMSQKLETSAVN